MQVAAPGRRRMAGRSKARGALRRSSESIRRRPCRSTGRSFQSGISKAVADAGVMDRSYLLSLTDDEPDAEEHEKRTGSLRQAGVRTGMACESAANRRGSARLGPAPAPAGGAERVHDAAAADTQRGGHADAAPLGDAGAEDVERVLAGGQIEQYASENEQPVVVDAEHALRSYGLPTGFSACASSACSCGPR